jgi:hypothetical protein
MTHFFDIGLAPGPDSPPTITQSMAVKSRQGDEPLIKAFVLGKIQYE